MVSWGRPIFRRNRQREVVSRVREVRMLRCVARRLMREPDDVHCGQLVSEVVRAGVFAEDHFGECRPRQHDIET
jgi:hypothetical protein